MRPGVVMGRWVAAFIGCLLMLLAGPAASASGDASVRFVHAAPGAGTAQLQASEGGITQRVGRASFGEVSGYSEVPSGSVRLELRMGGDALATTRERLRNRAHYTVVALGERLQVLRDGAARGGTARLRVVHAAPELGTVDIGLGDQVAAEGASFRSVSDYVSVEPGAYALRVTNPGDGSALAARGGVPLTAGTSSTAFVVGSAGEAVEIVVAPERMAAPRRAPATGLGGLADDQSRLLLALVAGLLAALAGGAAYLTLTARSRRGGS